MLFGRRKPGYTTTVDAASQLRDDGRFATDILQRLGVQAGYRDVTWAITERKRENGVSTNPDPDVFGLNNASRAATTAADAGTARTTGTAGFGSDILVLRYQAAETFPGSGVADRTMINCLGGSTGTTIPADRDDRMVSILHVAESQGELSLMCTSTTTGWPRPTAANWVLRTGCGLSCCGLCTQPARVKLAIASKPSNKRCSMFISPKVGTRWPAV